MPMALIAGLLAPVVVAPSALALDGTGEYGTWTETTPKKAGEFTLGSPGSGFDTPAATWSADHSGATFPSGASAWLGANTPFGAYFGSSRDLPYMNFALGSKPSATITYTFARPTLAGNWGFAFGDIDADKVKISATDANGAPVSVATWFEGAFNLCAVSPRPSGCSGGVYTDVPTWNGVDELIGNGLDSHGAAGWFMPKQSIKTLTFTFTKITGFPAFFTWFASDVPEPQVLPEPVEEIIPEAIAPVGTTVLVEKTVTTSAGKRVRVKVTCTKPKKRSGVKRVVRGDVKPSKPCTVKTRPKSGRVTLTTYGIPTTVTLTLAAPAAPAKGFAPFRYTKKYSVKKPKPSK